MLTREQIESMNPGAAMDAYIAEFVMGWKPWVSPMVPRGSKVPDCWQTGSRKRPTVRIDGWRPSREIPSAWDVAESLRDGGDIHIESVVYGTGWKVSTCFVRGAWDKWAYGPTFPLAICRAALLSRLS